MIWRYRYSSGWDVWRCRRCGRPAQRSHRWDGPRLGVSVLLVLNILQGLAVVHPALLSALAH
jgi:hypothetical protein